MSPLPSFGSLEERLRRASGSQEQLFTVLHDPSREVLMALLDNPRLTEEHLLILLARRDLPGEFFRELSFRDGLLKNYRVKLAMARHPRTPRSVSLPLLRYLFLFDLVGIALTPGTPAELRRVAEEAVLTRLPTLSLGERISLARRGSGRMAAALILDRERQVFETALHNPHVTEDLVQRALGQEDISAEAVGTIAEHPRWSTIYSVRLALLRNPLASLARVLVLAEQVQRRDLAEIVHDRRMPLNRRAYLARLADQKRQKRRTP